MFGFNTPGCPEFCNFSAAAPSDRLPLNKSPAMIKNYLKVALRNLWKSKGFTAINIIGLATGLGVCLLIVLYVTDELSYDRFNVNADRIYRVDDDINFNNTQLTAVLSPKPLGVTMVNNYPEVEQTTRVQGFNSDVMVKQGADWIQEHHHALADSNFFRVFTFPFIAGDPATALNAPHSVVIDETTSRRHFKKHGLCRQDFRNGEQEHLQNHRRHPRHAHTFAFPFFYHRVPRG